MITEEHRSFHVLALSAPGNYEFLKEAFAKHHSWQDTEAYYRHYQEKLPNKQLADKGLSWQKLEQLEIKLALNSDAEFPQMLREIPWLPHGLYFKGESLEPQEITIALVGTRKATSYGKNLAHRFAKELATLGITVVSGLALGIDAAAHEGTLEAKGKTIAVLAGGLEKFYPRQNEALARRIIASRGTLISEYPPDSPNFPNRFIERNRLISGLSKGVIVIEAPKGSGALTTAKFALEQNREVLVVPGQIDSPNYAGSHELIKAGAGLVASVSDVIENLGLEELMIQKKTERDQSLTATLDENQGIVINVLKSAGRSLPIDDIVKLSKLETSAVNSALSFLLIKNIIKEDKNNYYI